MAACMLSLVVLSRAAAAQAPPDSVAHEGRPDSSATAAPPPSAALRMADTVTVLPPMHVEGDRAVPDVRGSATTLRLSLAAITRFLPSTAGDALIGAPGVELVRTGAWSSQVAIRGLAGERVLLMVDGVRLNTGRGHGAQSSLVPVERLDAIEVSPGAGSAAYGSDALGGVVNLVTHRDLFAARPSVAIITTARGSTPGDEAAGSVRVRYRSTNVGAELAGGLSRLRALATPDSVLPNSGQHERDLVGRLSLRRGAAMLDLEHAHHAARDVGIPAFSSASGSSASYPLQAREATRLEMGWRETGPWALRLLASDQRYPTDFRETTIDYDSLRGRRIATTTVDASDRIRTRVRGLQPELRIGPAQAIVLAGEYRLETTGGPRTTTSQTQNMAGSVTGGSERQGASMPGARREVWSARLGAGGTRWGVRVDGGVRFDRYRSQADSFEVRDDPGRFKPPIDVSDRRWSIEGGCSRRTGPFEPYLHVGTGFRSPSLEERFYDDDIHGGLRLFGNRDLRAERSLSREVGVRAVGERGSIRLSVYRADVDDLITLRYLDLVFGVPRFQYVNVERARLEGLELTTLLRAGGVHLGAHAAAPRGRDRDSGARLTDIGATRVAFDLGIPLPRAIPQGIAGLRARWTDAVPLEDRASEGERLALPRPAFWALAVEAGTTLWGSRLTLAVRNLLNHRYREPLGFIDEPGRTVAVAVQRGFEMGISGRAQGAP
jgi:hemoglobin/transferrin/lactoferrin receptor protein